MKNLQKILLQNHSFISNLEAKRSSAQKKAIMQSFCIL